MPDGLEHAANLLIAALMQNHLEPGVRARLFNLANFRGRGDFAILQLNAPTQTRDPAFGGHAFDLHFVDFLNAIARRGNVIGKVAVVGQQQQTLCVEVQTPHRMQTAERRWNQFRHQRPPFRISHAGQITFRFVKQ